MGIKDFGTTLSWAMDIVKTDTDIEMFKKKFDSIMNQVTEYIKLVVKEKGLSSKLSQGELIQIVLEDYNKIIDEIYRSANIYNMSMKYNATMYLCNHKEQIQGLLEEAQKRQIKPIEENYTDDFHENLLLTVVLIDQNYQKYYDEMKNCNPEFLKEIEDLVQNFGKEEAFKRFYSKYDKIKKVPLTNKMKFMSYAYHIIFGIEGAIEKELSDNSPVIKNKKKCMIKDFVDIFFNGTEKIYLKELKETIISKIKQLERMGEISQSVLVHNEKMRRACLPDLRYFSSKDSNEPATKVSQIFDFKELDKMSVDTLLRMNSFYNNRFAKTISKFAMALFVIDNSIFFQKILNEEPITKNSLSEEVLDGILLKYQVLINPVKRFFIESQQEIQEEPDKFKEYVQTIKYSDQTEIEKTQYVLPIDGFCSELKDNWNDDYERYFNQRLRNINNNLNADTLLMNTLYQPVFFSYRFKHQSLQAEYAYMHHMAEENPDMNLNFGIVLSKKGNKEGDNTILLASDGGTELSNRLHMFREAFVDFLKSYTGRTLVRVYEGFDDYFIFGSEYISSQILAPTNNKRNKLLKDLIKGNENSNNKSRLTEGNRKLVEHMLFNIGSSDIMKSHATETTMIDKKGKPIKCYRPIVRYKDMSTNILYTRQPDGSLVDKDGNIYGKNPEEIRGIDE